MNQAMNNVFLWCHNELQCACFIGCLRHTPLLIMNIVTSHHGEYLLVMAEICSFLGTISYPVSIGRRWSIDCSIADINNSLCLPILPGEMLIFFNIPTKSSTCDKKGNPWKWNGQNETMNYHWSKITPNSLHIVQTTGRSEVSYAMGDMSVLRSLYI